MCLDDFTTVTTVLGLVEYSWYLGDVTARPKCWRLLQICSA